MSTVLAPPPPGAAVTNGASGTVKLDALLTTTSVPDRAIDLELFRRAMVAEGLPAELVPDKQSDVRTFQSVCSSMATRRAGKDAKGTYVEVTRIVSDADECVYMVTVGEKDAANRDLAHKNAMRVVFDKTPAAVHNPIRIEIVDNARYEALREIEHKIRLTFEMRRGKLPGAKVREILRTCFRRWHATRWARNASVWFVPIDHADKLAGMERVLRDTYGSDAEFCTLDVAADVAQVEAKAGEHAHAEAGELMKDMADLLAADKIKPDQLARVQERRQGILDYIDRMEKLVGGEVRQMNVALQLVDQQMIGLLAKAAK